jgi:5-methylcytosine-specific restriction endonuclease McrA
VIEAIVAGVVANIVFFLMPGLISIIARLEVWTLEALFPDAAPALSETLANEIRVGNPLVANWRALLFIPAAPWIAVGLAAAEQNSTTNTAVPSHWAHENLSPEADRVARRVFLNRLRRYGRASRQQLVLASSTVSRGELRRPVFLRDNFRCVYCGRAFSESVLSSDHFILLRAGGMTTIDNLVTACSACNARKADRLP